jgi:probable rRNA maturation factor
MVNVLIKTDSHYTVNRRRIRRVVEKILAEKKVKGKVEVSITIAGDRLVRKLNKKYRDTDETTDVLSFPLTEEKIHRTFIEAPDGILRLGDIIISYPQVIEEAAEGNSLVDDKIDELVIHGLLHLLGQHHE